MKVTISMIRAKKQRAQAQFPLYLLVLILFASILPLGAQSPVGTDGSDEAFFTRELCPPGAAADECQVVTSFSLEDQPYSIAIVENYFFRSSTFGIAQASSQGWELITAGPLMDLEVMAYSPADPFAYENYPGILVEVPPVVLYELLEQVASYFDELYGY